MKAAELFRNPESRDKILVFLLLVLITLPLLTKVFTSDFGTHLAVGRQVVQTRSVPDSEFLNYPSLGARNYFSEWGFQTLLYLLYTAAGIYGVSFFCWLAVFGIFFFLHRSMVLRGANPYLALLAIFAFSGFLRIRIQPRPEIVTYLFIALSVYILTEYYFGKRRRLIYLFPPMILVWANMHATYLMAFLLFGAFFADALARAAWNGEFRLEKLKAWIGPPVLVGILGLALCGLNPHRYDAILAPLHLISRGGGASPVMMSISELTPVKGTGFYSYYMAAAAFAGASLLLGAVGRRIYILDLFLFAIAFKGAWDSARAVSMMGLFLSPGSSLHLTGFLEKLGAWTAAKVPAKPPPAADRDPGKRKKGQPKSRAQAPEPPPKTTGRPVSWARMAVVGILSVSILVFGGVTLVFSFSQLEYGVGMTQHKFSMGAAEFIRNNPIRGNMFNFFDIGGFLDWQVYPKALTFIDGRTYNQDVFMEHQTVTGAMSGWENVLARYGVTYVVTKALDSSGMILPLFPALANHPGWVPVFADGLFVVFVRNTPENRPLIMKYEIPRKNLPYQVIWESYHYMYLGVSPMVAYQTMSNMYRMMGDYASAAAMLRKGLETAEDPFLRAQLNQLEQAGGSMPNVRRP